MKALSIRQPWAWLIVKGYKDVENRSWPTYHRGPLLIHAARNCDLAGHHLARELGIEVPPPELLPTGGIVGQARLVNCVRKWDSPWFSGPFGFVLAGATEVGFMATRGYPGLFEVELPVLLIPSEARV
jgi:hypothetical protein